jgi:hypothetical protein
VVLVTATGIAMAESKSNGPVKVKIVKIVDGDTTTIEKTMDETKVEDFTKQFQNIKGKNVRVMITIEDINKSKKEKNKSEQSMHFNFDMDSSMAKAFAKAFVFSGDSLKELNLNDSIFKNVPKNFDFDFNFDDKGIMNDFDFKINTDEDGKIIIKSGKDKTIIINGDKDNISISKSEGSKSKTKTKTITINDEKGKKKKMIVTTSVIVMDADDEKDDGVYKSDRKKSKDDMEFSFYPNPSEGNFVLEMNIDEKEPAQIKITDMDGKEIYNEKLSGNGKVSKTIDLSGKKGTFIVTIKQGKKVTSKKIIVE